MRTLCIWALAAGLGFWTSAACASIAVQTVRIGNPGNAGEWSGESYGGFGPDRLCGAVDYTYRMGKYEITAGQYTAFLNAVAATDTYGLYNPNMADPVFTPQNLIGGCNIQRGGSPGSYTYSVASDWANRPVNYVSWGDAARFANWMHNGQPSGAQGASTTEDGSYFLNGATSNIDLLAITREPNATWVIPSEDEWYKAAYHKNDGVTGHYHDYPTRSDSAPSNDLVDPDPGNNATFRFVEGDDYTIGNPYYRTEIGAHENSESPYGTFDQGGNVSEWNEAIIDGTDRGVRGGSFTYYDFGLRSGTRQFVYPEGEQFGRGFRLAFIPEPATISLLLLGGLAVLSRKKRQ